MKDKHPLPPVDTTPKQSGGANTPDGTETKPLPEPVVNVGQSPLIDHNLPVHQVKPVPPGSLPVGAEGAINLRYVIQADGASARVFGEMVGTGGTGVDLGVLPGLTVS